MFKNSRSSSPHGGEASQPLLGFDETVRDDRTVFSVHDSDDEEESVLRSALRGPGVQSAASVRSVRFEEDVQVFGTPLRSTMASREAGVCVSPRQRSEQSV
jgi:hypothetical protein